MPNKWVVLVAEDELSNCVLQQIIKEQNPSLCIHLNHITRGFGGIKSNANKYIQASQVIPHIVLTDLDNYPCPLALMDDWNLQNLPPSCIFRIAVRAVEAWLLADRVGFSNFLSIALNRITAYPEQLPNPKLALLNLANSCRNGELKRGLLPSANSGAVIGPLYNQLLGEFVRTNWNIVRASQNSESLNRTIVRIAAL